MHASINEMSSEFITFLDHVTYFARPPPILLCLILRQFVVSIFHTQYRDKHIQREKFLVLKSIANMQCPHEPNCCNYLTTHKTTTCEFSTSLDFLSCQSRQEISCKESIKFCKDACRYRSIESNHFTVAVTPLRPCQPI